MQSEFLSAAAAFPTVVFTAALVVVAGFWLLVLCGIADHDGFDADLDADVLRLGRVPASVSLSVGIALAWLLSLAGSVALARTEPPGLFLLKGALFVLAPTAAWWITTRALRPPAKPSPDEPGVASLDTPLEATFDAALDPDRAA
ncbi:hypothetical protein [Streptomyces vilmorinianum]|uniref:hypothetical protein n=1 Tax=Streptomyces vilmorinianum TaxID=3051092 RepID=UPI0010FB9636|nr:hypothetical protein [Streptomyces vilmorinianum]